MKISITANTSWYLYNFRRNTISALLNAGYEVVIYEKEDSKMIILACAGFTQCYSNI